MGVVAGDLLVVQAARVSLHARVGDEGDGLYVAFAGLGLDPARDIGVGEHFATPDAVGRFLDLLRRDRQAQSAARSARFQGQHQAGPLRRAATERRPKTEPAMPARDKAGAGFGDREVRVPHQRPVRKNPDRLARRRRLQHLMAAGLAFLVGEQCDEAFVARLFDDLGDGGVPVFVRIDGGLAAHGARLR
jgi:hypothetical protein